jgi:phenylacetic acid degradation operon negative regulatory protein
VGSLIDLLAPLEVSEGAVRTALSRMTSRGWLSSERRGRNAFYSLTPQGRKLLEEGERRIYHPTWDEPWDGRWQLVSYSVPEEERSLRDRLRRRLSWIGFGSLGNGLWITPHDAAGRVREVVDELEIHDRVEVFEGRHLGFSDARRLVRRCWDLPEVHDRYVDFIDRHLPEFERFREERAEGRLAAEDAYVHRFDLVHEYREFPLVDPYLPGELLPDDWAGGCAAGLFRALHDLLEEPARAHLEDVLGRAQARTDSTVSVAESAS